MRQIDLIVIHCSDSEYAHHDNYESIRKWHIDENGWSDVGYHFLILKSGEVVACRPIERPGAHCKGFNSNSIGICLTGMDIFSDEQIRALRDLIVDLLKEHDLNGIDVLGHYELDFAKTCPNFDVYEKIKGLDS